MKIILQSRTKVNKEDLKNIEQIKQDFKNTLVESFNTDINITFGSITFYSSKNNEYFLNCKIEIDS